MDKLSQLLGGIPPDHIKLSFSIFFTYPCAILYQYMNPYQKHLFSITYSTIIMLFILKLYDGFIHIFTISFISFVFMKYYQNRKHAAWINFTLVMISMSLCHLGRQLKGFEGDTKLDYSGALMIITIKLSSFGFNVIDKYSTKDVSLHTSQMKIETFPSFIQYFGWIFYFPGFLAGPSCEYMHYFRTVESNVKPTFHVWRPALKTCSKSIFFMLFLVLLAPKFNYFEALKPEWEMHSFWYKMLFIQLSAILTRCKYYFIWYLSEGACILSGFGFNGYDKENNPLWNKLTNVNVLSCEFAQSYKMLTENWNIGANHWLRHYVYLRFNPPGTAASTLKTYIISSLWHGFHPGFYLFFMISSSLQVLSRQIRKTIRPFFITNKNLKFFYDTCTWITSMGILNMLVPCFDLLHVPKIMHVWRQIYYCHFIVIFIGASIYFILKPFLMSIQKEKQVDGLNIKEKKKKN